MKNLTHYLLFYSLMNSALTFGQSTPAISTFSPSSGPAGTTVTITGTNFSTTAAENIVYFGAAKAAVNSAAASQLVVSVPIGATYQPIAVTVSGLTAYSNAPFSVTFPFSGSIGASFSDRIDFGAGYQTKGGIVCDLDGDGKNDVVVTDQGNNTVSVFRNVSTPGTISWDSFEPKIDFATGQGAYAVAAGDLDGDGKPELVVANIGGTSMSVFHNTGTAGSISFSSTVEFETLPTSTFVAIQDLDLDGKSDIVVTGYNSYGEGNVSIFRNTSTVGSISSTSFATKVDFVTGQGGSWGVALSDVDGDGKTDMAVTSIGEGLVSIFRNISTPGSITASSFEPKVDFATGGYPAIVSLADIDGDQKNDLIVGNAGDGAGGYTVSIFRNIGSPGSINAGSFDARVNLSSSTGSWNPTVGDVNGDGKLDLIVREGSNGTLSIYKNIGSPGTVTTNSFSQPYSVETGGSPLGISIADMDGDGKSDLTVSNEGSNLISVFRNLDVPEPLPPTITTFSPSSGAAGTTVTITGTNFSTTPTKNTVYFGAAKATVNSASVSQLNVTVPFGASYQPITVTVNKLTAYSSSPFNITFPFSGSLGASFSSRTDFWAGYQTKGGIVCDLDGDGKNDVVVTDQGNNTVSTFRNISTPGSISWDSFESKLEFAAGSGAYAVAAGDLDGDGKPDLVVANINGSTLSILRNTSTAGFISFSSTLQFETLPSSSFVAIQDIDLDGKSDIVITSFNTAPGEGSVSIFRNTTTFGSISFASRVDIVAGHGIDWGLALGDVDGDGKIDMAVTSVGNGDVSLFRNISTPGSITSDSFEPKVEFATGGYPAIVSIADLDGDGKNDLIVGNTSDGAGSYTTSIFRNIGSPGIINTSTFDARVMLASSDSPWNPTVGDADGDGKPDLIVREGSNGMLSIFKNISSPGVITTNSFSPPYTVETGGAPLGISIADMDGDGKSDLTISNEGTNVISVFRNLDIFEPSAPSHLVFTNITNTTLTGKFSASPDLPDGYIVIRRNGSSPNAPVNGTTYSIGQVIGNDVVAYVGSGTTFNESGLDPGVEYYYNAYASNGDGATIEYITSKWATKTVMTIGIDMGPIVTVSPATFTLDDEITITFDATKSFPVNALVGASQVYMYSGTISEGPESGNWNRTNYSYMNSLGDNKWSITFIPRYFYGYIPTDEIVYRLAMVFLDQQSHRGVSFDGSDIYLPVLPTPPPTALPATFVSNTGFEAEWNSMNNFYEYHLDVSTTETFEFFVNGYEDKIIYSYNSGTIRNTVAGLAPGTNYFYRVRAAGIPGNSSTISVTTVAHPPMASRNVWVKQNGGIGNEEIQTMASDDKGNVYAAGHFSGTITLGSKTLTSKGEYDIFFVRYNDKGHVVWARSIGGAGQDNEVSLAVDSKGLYMTAQFSGDIDVDPGNGITQFNNEGQYYLNDGFFAKYNLENGSIEWGRHLVDAAAGCCTSIEVDQTGVYLTGHYNGTVDFDPGHGVALLTSQADDIFLAKYSSKGKYLWAGSMGGYDWDSGFGLLVDATGVYMSGYYSWGSDFDPSPNYYPLDGSGGFFGRYDRANGNLIYVKNVGNGIIWNLDKHGADLYVAGEFNGSIDADPDGGVQIIGTDGLNSGMIAKYNKLDGSYRWAKNMASTWYIGPRRVIADGSGVYVGGYFGGSVDFDSAPAMANRTAINGNAFAAYYESNGTLDWVKGIGGTEHATSIAATLTDDGFYLAGLFNNTVNFDPYQGSEILTSTGGDDIFIARYRLTKKVKKDYGKDESAIASNEDCNPTTLFPNPTENVLGIDWHGFSNDEPIEVRILDLLGNPVLTRTMSTEEKAIDVSRLSPGYHILQARQNNQMQTLRFMKK